MYKYISIYTVWCVCVIEVHSVWFGLSFWRPVQGFLSHHSGSLLCLHLKDLAEWSLQSWQVRNVWIYKFLGWDASHRSPLHNLWGIQVKKTLSSDGSSSFATCFDWNSVKVAQIKCIYSDIGGNEWSLMFFLITGAQNHCLYPFWGSVISLSRFRLWCVQPFEKHSPRTWSCAHMLLLQVYICPSFHFKELI